MWNPLVTGELTPRRRARRDPGSQRTACRPSRFLSYQPSVEVLGLGAPGLLLGIAANSTYATVKVWGAQINEIRTLCGHTSWVESVAFSPDRKRIASASLDGTVKIWKALPLPESTGAADKETPQFAQEDHCSVADWSAIRSGQRAVIAP
jgi:hypothetical protein